MTGYGRAAATASGHSVVVEIRTVNHRFLELKLRGAGLAVALEDAVAARIRASFERGVVLVSLAVRSGEAGAPRLDRTRAHQIFRDLSALAAELGLPPPSLADLLSQQGVTASEPGTDLIDDATVLALVDQAVAATIGMRRTEGEALARDLTARLTRLAAITAELSDLASQGAQVVAARLHERVVRLLNQLEPSLSVDPGRLAQEVAVIVDRADITEELVRLTSHLDQAQALVAQPGPVGRRLEFLLQEIGRELNTVGAKSWSAAISTRVVEAKSELEKLREQAQNVE